jgi:hypothetical protein
MPLIKALSHQTQMLREFFPDELITEVLLFLPVKSLQIMENPHLRSHIHQTTSEAICKKQATSTVLENTGN